MPYEMTDSRGQKITIYSDHNVGKLFNAPRSISHDDEIGFGCLPPAMLYSSEDDVPLTRYTDDYPLIPEDEWDERIEEMDAKEMWPEDHFRFRSYDQNGTPYCWINCVAQAMTLCRDVQGQSHVRISSASMGGPITGYRSRGGWPQEGVEYAMETGGVPQDEWPNNAISRRYYDDTVEHRERYRIVEAYKCSRESFAEAASAAMRGHCAIGSFNWWRHAVMFPVRIVKLSDEIRLAISRECKRLGLEDYGARYGGRIRNSWSDNWGDRNKHGVGGFSTLTGSKANPSDNIVIASVTSSTAL